MVVLLPTLEGERPKTCACGTTGICSPVRERTTFYVVRSKRGYRTECRRCSTRLARERYRTSPARKLEVQRRAQRRYKERHGERRRRADRESRRRRRAEDPEFAARERAAMRRYRAKVAQDAERAQAARERDRMNYRGRREREGLRMEIKETRKGGGMRSGIYLPIGPFRAFVADLLREEEEASAEENARQRRKGATRRVASRLDVDVRRVYAYLHELTRVDEMVVDHAVSREGSRSLYDLYPAQLDYAPAQLELTA